MAILLRVPPILMKQDFQSREVTLWVYRDNIAANLAKLKIVKSEWFLDIFTKINEYRSMDSYTFQENGQKAKSCGTMRSSERRSIQDQSPRSDWIMFWMSARMAFLWLDRYGLLLWRAALASEKAWCRGLDFCRGYSPGYKGWLSQPKTGIPERDESKDAILFARRFLMANLRQSRFKRSKSRFTLQSGDKFLSEILKGMNSSYRFPASGILGKLNWKGH